MLQARLAEQRIALNDNIYGSSRSLDYAFHEAVRAVGETDFAFDVIAQEKAKVDRLCVSGLARDERLDQLLDYHVGIVQMVSDNDAVSAVGISMRHLSRLDATINAIREEHADFFDDYRVGSEPVMVGHQARQV